MESSLLTGSGAPTPSRVRAWLPRLGRGCGSARAYGCLGGWPPCWHRQRHQPPLRPTGHVLVALARRHGKSHEANAALFRKSYEEGANISDAAVLLEVGRQLGLPEAELEAALR